MGAHEGAVAIVTGASRGIGLGIAQRLVDEGARVVITARKPEALAAAVEQLGGSSHSLGIAGNAADDTATGGAADFGQCTPTIFRQGGLGGRPATEFTFQITDELARGGQQEALNPNIITNALCNQLTNVCGANAAAVAQCESAKAAVQAAGTRDDSTVTLFNGAIQGGAAKRLARRWVA